MTDAEHKAAFIQTDSATLLHMFGWPSRPCLLFVQTKKSLGQIPNSKYVAVQDKDKFY